MLGLAASLFIGCGASTASSGTTTTPSRAVVAQRLETRLASDPNRALCERVATSFASGNTDTLRPLFDFAAFAERIIARGNLPPDAAAHLRADPSAPQNFARYLAPRESQYRCLGTRSLLGEPHLAIRQWTPTRWDYVLLRLTGNAEHPFDDYHIVSSGTFHSELQAASFDPQLRAPMEIVGRFLQQSYDGDFAGIIAAYRTLPPSLQDSPLAFFHYVNAVFTSEPTGSALYRETVARMETVWRGRDYALAYWQRIDGQRRGDGAMEERARARLVELLDDYELL